MADLKENLIESLRVPREFAEKLGYKNAKSAVEGTSEGFLETSLNNGLRFFDRTTIGTDGKTISQGGRTYDIDIKDGHLNENTIAFFAESFSAYCNYTAIVDTMQGFYTIYGNVLNNEPGLDLGALVGDAVLNPGDTPGSLRLDVLYFKNQSMGSLRQRAAGFEDALHYMFGYYDRKSPASRNNQEVNNFIEDVCAKVLANYTSETPDKQAQIRAAIVRGIQTGLERGSERANAISNIEIACNRVNGSFVGVNHENYHEKMAAYIERVTKDHDAIVGGSGVYALYSECMGVSGRTTKNNAIVSKANSALSFWTTKYPELGGGRITTHQVRTVVTARRQAIFEQLEENEKRVQRNKQVAHGEREKVLSGSEVRALERELGKYNFELRVLGERTFPFDNDGQVFVHNGVKYPAIAPDQCNRQIEVCERDNLSISDITPYNDAMAILACCSMLYSLNLDVMGGEIVNANGVLNQIGFNRDDLKNGPEQQLQALSILNNLHYLNLEAYANDPNHGMLFEKITELRNMVYNLDQRYATPGRDGKLPAGKLNRNELISNMMKICSDPQNGPLFGRGAELLEQYGVALREVNENMAAASYNATANMFSTMDPKLKNLSYRNAIFSFYEKQKLIPAKEIKIGEIKFILGKEYEPHTVIEDPGPEERPIPPPLDYCREMNEALLRKRAYVDGSENEATQSGNGTAAAFNDSMAKKITAVRRALTKYYDKPEEYFKKMQEIHTKLETGGKINSRDMLLLMFAPGQFFDADAPETGLDQYFQQIAHYQAERARYIAGEEGALSYDELMNLHDSLAVGAAYSKGQTKSIFPDSMNRGIKFAFTCMLDSQFTVDSKGDLKFSYKMNGSKYKNPVEYFRSFMTLAQKSNRALEQIMDSQVHQQFGGMFTMTVVDGKITLEPGIYLKPGGRGAAAITNTFDRKSHTQNEKRFKSNNIPETDKVWVADPTAEGGVRQVTAAEYNDKFSNQGANLVQIQPGVYVPTQSFQEIYDLQVKKLREMGMQGVRIETYQEYMDRMVSGMVAEAGFIPVTDEPISGDDGMGPGGGGGVPLAMVDDTPGIVPPTTDDGMDPLE